MFGKNQTTGRTPANTPRYCNDNPGHVAALQGLCDAYFAKQREEGLNPTITGLAIACGFYGRQELADYVRRGGPCADVVKKAKARVVESYEQLALLKPQAAGSIVFILKNLGWSDKQEVEHSGQVGSVVRLPAKAAEGAAVELPDASQVASLPAPESTPKRLIPPTGTDG